MKNLFLRPCDLKLLKTAQEVDQNQLNSSQIKKIAQLMLKIIQVEQKGKKKGVGLAAPQIGILKRIILVDTKANGQGLPAGRQGKTGNLRVYINPEIVWKSKREGEWYEGCFSTGNVCGIVPRSISIKIQGIVLQPKNLQARFVKEKYTGYVARIFQHEIDHLNGQVFINHITDPNKLHWVLPKEFEKYRKSWKTWPKKCSFDKWQEIKGVKARS